ncbi:MAG: pantoate--beta-alanine ligase [Saprospiraceae bacterium]|nr:pantoate--beta-alanine ligase [Saprospiraceae bacterium]MCB0623500.1 pantoate--beta-alanine ligase [Saprospiraceae bacterium]MCB0679914.1 pantoate--beta-alanine ligase [Saprospiraceae bacterium]
MFLFKRVNDLRSYLQAERRLGRTVGFAPTMGALHEGHLSLLRRAGAENDLSVASIFVNPTQFNEASDLEKYPRTESKDVRLLLKVGCSALFMPPVEEVYPPEGLESPAVDLAGLDTPLEGEHRPGHFQGVAQVVGRLLSIVEPDALYMGQKDFQQFVIVRRLLQELRSPVRLVMGATVREADGLAMSSRNVRLSAEQRLEAPRIFRTLERSRELCGRVGLPSIREMAWEELSRPPFFQPEYFEIVDGYSLHPVQSLKDASLVVACTAVRVGEVRLIDNLILQGDPHLL